MKDPKTDPIFENYPSSPSNLEALAPSKIPGQERLVRPDVACLREEFRVYRGQGLGLWVRDRERERERERHRETQRDTERERERDRERARERERERGFGV